MDSDRIEKLAKVLSAKGRKQIKEKNFALPGRRYPIHDRSHAINALARVSQHGTPEEKAKVRSAVNNSYGGISQEKMAAMRDELEKIALAKLTNDYIDHIFTNSEIEKMARITYSTKFTKKVKDKKSGETRRVQLPEGELPALTPSPAKAMPQLGGYEMANLKKYREAIKKSPAGKQVAAKQLSDARALVTKKPKPILKPDFTKKTPTKELPKTKKEKIPSGTAIKYKDPTNLNFEKPKFQGSKIVGSPTAFSPRKLKPKVDAGPRQLNLNLPINSPTKSTPAYLQFNKNPKLQQQGLGANWKGMGTKWNLGGIGGKATLLPGQGQGLASVTFGKTPTKSPTPKPASGKTPAEAQVQAPVKPTLSMPTAQFGQKPTTPTTPVTPTPKKPAQTPFRGRMVSIAPGAKPPAAPSSLPQFKPGQNAMAVPPAPVIPPFDAALAGKPSAQGEQLPKITSAGSSPPESINVATKLPKTPAGNVPPVSTDTSMANAVAGQPKQELAYPAPKTKSRAQAAYEEGERSRIARLIKEEELAGTLTPKRRLQIENSGRTIDPKKL